MTPELWKDWLKLYKSLGNSAAAPFIQFVPSGFKKQSKRILYIGKATKGLCAKHIFDSEAAKGDEPARTQSENFSRAVFEKRGVKGSGPSFWGFAHDLSIAINPRAKNLGNLAWTNICKIGSPIDNPVGHLFEAQKDLAIRTLEYEIDSLKPSVIVCVADSFANPVLLPVLGKPNDEVWGQSEKEAGSEVEGVWWLQSSVAETPVVWLRHPQGSKKEIRDFAIKKAVELTQR